MYARSGRLLILLLVPIGFVTSIAHAAENEADRAALEAQLKQLHTEHIATAKRARAAAQAAYEAETAPLSDLLWAVDAVWNAELAAASTAAAKIDAYVRHIQDLKQVDEKIEFLFQNGQRGGEAEKQARTKCCLERAVIALVEHCLASGQPPPQGKLLSAAQP